MAGGSSHGTTEGRALEDAIDSAIRNSRRWQYAFWAMSFLWVLAVGVAIWVFLSSATGGGDVSPIGPVAYYSFRSEIPLRLRKDEVKIVPFAFQFDDPHKTVETRPNWKFTAPRSGFYTVTASVGCLAPARKKDPKDKEPDPYGYLTVGVYLGRDLGVRPADINLARQQLGPSWTTLGGTATVKLDKGQFLDVRVSLEDEPTATVGGTGYTWVSISYVGLPR